MKKPRSLWSRGRVSVAGTLRLLTLIVVGIIFVLVVNQQTSNHRQIESTRVVADNIKRLTISLNDAVKTLKTDNHSDHDLLIKYLQCTFNLFGSRPGEVITQSDLDACLDGTRIAPRMEPSSLRSAPSTGTEKSPGAERSSPTVTQSDPSPTPSQPPATPSTPQQPAKQNGLAQQIIDNIQNLLNGLPFINSGLVKYCSLTNSCTPVTRAR